MPSQFRRWAVMAGVSLLTLGFSAACGAINPLRSGGDAGATPSETPAVSSAVQPAALSKPTSGTTTGPRTVPVKRDTIVETLALDGVVAPQEQVTLTFPAKVAIDDVKVKSGQAVKQGEVLMTVSDQEGKINNALEGARGRLQTAKTNLIQAQAQADSLAQAAAARAATDQQQQQLAAVDGQAALRRAQDNLAKVQAGASAADRQAAQNVVETAAIAFQKALNDMNKLNAGPDPDAVRSAQRDVNTAQIAAQKAQTDLDVLTRGPDAGVVRDAQAEVDRAQTRLQLAQLAKIDPKADPATAKVQHEAAIQEAQLAIQAAQGRLIKLKQPPADFDVQTAKQRLTDAQDALAAARAKLASIQNPPEQTTIDAQQAVIDKAQKSLSIAQLHADEVNSHPTPNELADARDQVRKAQTGLDSGQRGPLPAIDAGPDLAALQAAVDQAQADVVAAQKTMAGLVVTAPFDGTVVGVRVKSQEVVSSITPLIVVARAGPPLVRIQLADEELARVSVGQPATILGTGSPATPLLAQIVSVTPGSSDGSTSPSAILKPSWPDGQAPKFGTPVQIAVTVGQRQDVLVVPKGALRQAGGYASVEVQDGTIRRLVRVEVGLQADSTVEIESGLTEGQQVLVGRS